MGGGARQQLEDERMTMIPPTPVTTSSSLSSSSSIATTSSNATSNALLTLDRNGGPIVPPPPPRLMKDSFMLVFYYYTIFPLFLPVIKVIGGSKLPWKDLWNMFITAYQARCNPVSALAEFQNDKLLQQLYSQQSALHYVHRNSLVWQASEGYCAAATVCCVLGSYAFINKQAIPKQTFKESSPESVCNLIHEVFNAASGSSSSCNNTISTQIVRGDTVTYDEFVATIRDAANDSNKRIMINYHRPPLFGVPKNPLLHPLNFIVYSVLAGHFSPILGVVENDKADHNGTTTTNNPLVGIWDVNHKYGGAYLVPAKRLYTSVTARDFWSGQSRALVVVTSHSDTNPAKI